MGSGSLDDLRQLLLAHCAAALVLTRAGARVGPVAHGVAFAADNVDWRRRAVLLQLAHPLALDALECGSTGEVEADDNGIAAFVGQSAVVSVLDSCRGVLNGDFTATFACLEVGLVEIERVCRTHSIDEEVLCELDGKGGFAASIITYEYNSLL